MPADPALSHAPGADMLRPLIDSCLGVVVLRMLAVVLLALSGAAAAQQPPLAPPPPAAEADPMDKMVCRRQLETGSLVRAKRQCHTRRQWAYLDEQNQTSARQLVDDTRSRPGSN